MNWFKWHALNIGLYWRKILGLLRKQATSDVHEIGQGNEAIIRNGSPFGFEMHVADRFYEFWNQDHGSLVKMNIYVHLHPPACRIVCLEISPRHHASLRQSR
ncbi:MAG: hypothetical protein FJZ79_10570 [Chlorobi bacterium]|nr:hypothetical protein [Chlorobiota bacterium]